MQNFKSKRSFSIEVINIVGRNTLGEVDINLRVIQAYTLFAILRITSKDEQRA